MYDFKYNDGGRHKAHKETGKDIFFGPADDCVTRALAIVSDKDYVTVWDLITGLNSKENKKHTANNGVRHGSLKAIMSGLGFEYVPTIKEVAYTTGNFRTTIDEPMKLKEVDIPAGKVFVLLTRHATAFIDGVMNDTHVCSQGNTKCYGYYVQRAEAPIMYNVHSAVTGKPLNIAPLNYDQAATMARLLMLNYKKESTIKPSC